MQAVIPNCRLYVVGSSLSGFGADWSDVDMCLMVAGRDLDQRTEATGILRILQRELYHCRKFSFVFHSLVLFQCYLCASQTDPGTHF